MYYINNTKSENQMYIKNDKYYSSFMCNNCCNKQIRVPLLKDKALSKQLEEKLKFEHLSGQHKKEISLNEVLTTYKNTMGNITLAQRRVRVYDVINLFKFARVTKIKDIGPDVCINYMSSFGPLAVSTVNRKKQYIKSFFDFCIQMDWLDKNPALRLKSERDKSPKKRRYFTPKELDVVMDYSGEYKEFWTFLLETGIRCTDVYCLATANFEGNWCKWFENKTKRWISIPLNSKAMKIVETKKGLLFPKFGTNYSKRKVTEHLQTLVPDAVLHTFRHTYAQNAGNKGVSKEVLQRLLGHSSVTTTEKYFNDINDESLQKFVDKL